MATSGAVIARIISQYSDKGTKAAQKDIAKMGKQIDNWSKKTVKSYAIATAAAGVFAYKIGKDAVNAAVEDAKSAAVLANTLRNVTGATNTQIAAVEEYISKTQMLVNVSDTDLRSSLNTLVAATGDVTTAQYLQTRALDAAIGSGKDVAAVTNAMAKASQGNFTALGKMFPQLDKSAIKSKDFSKVLTQLEGDYKGAAEAVAKQDPFTALKLQFGEVAEQLGYVLLPVVKEFATYLITDVVPNLQLWIETNKGKLQENLRATADVILSITVNLLKLVAVFEKYKFLILAIAAIPLINVLGTQAMVVAGFAKMITRALGAIKLAPIISGLRGLGAAVSLVSGAFRAGGFLAGLKGAITLFSTLNPYIRGATILITALAAGYALWKKVFSGTDVVAKNAKITNDQIAKQQQKSIVAGYEQITVGMKKAQQDKIAADMIAKNAAAQKKADDAAKKRAKFDADYAKINARIAKNYGVTLLSSEDQKMVQINAAEALLIRQDKLDKINLSLLNKLKEEVLLLKVKNDLSERYNDILKVLALSDDKLPGAIAVLAQKWGTTIEAVKAYILQFQIVSDGKISDDEVTKLAMSWGSTKEQAAKYLDFFVALNDGVLDTIEIDKLKSKWSMTEQQVRQYADFVGVVNDGKLDDSEVKKLMDKWKLSTDQVVEYIKQIGSPVSYSGTLIDPAKAAEIGWKNALAALLAYQAALGGKVVTTITPTTTTTPPVVTVIPPKSDGIGGRTDSAAESASKAAAAAYAAANAAGDSAKAAIAAAGVRPSDIALGESGAIGAASIAAQLKAADAAMAKAQRDALSNFKAAEALSAQNDSAASIDYDERFRFRNSLTMDNSKSLMAGGIASSGGNTTVNLTVNGTVQTEQDLVSSIRQGLLAGQTNGQGLTLQAI